MGQVGDGEWTLLQGDQKWGNCEQLEPNLTRETVGAGAEHMKDR